MNLKDDLLWKKTRQIIGKRKNIQLNLKDDDMEEFLQNWENNVFCRNDLYIDSEKDQR